MMLGKEIRLSRLLDSESKRFVGITVDHAMARGVLPGLVNIKETVRKIILGKPNALTMHKGIAEKVFPPYAGKVPLILKSTTFSPYHPKYDTPVADVEEALRLGADAISVGVIVGGPEQAEQITHLAQISKEASAMGLPLIAHIYPRGSEVKDPKNADAVSYAVRVGAELGVDIVKTNWTGSAESFAKVVAACPSRVVIAGGSSGNDLSSYLQMIWEGIQVGMAGVTCGRFVWEDSNPAAVIEAIKAIVHSGASVEKALEIYRECKER
ncbi:class I fructose-bisphosphate aldolase [Neomoorella thermoacetica]|uniref:2-amino-4, 5-dihydroxy-6-oxo-7-(Phosphonooxy)heptanoate synthase n=2 Tax=Neomoorella thermoacetica TaxID=1525 RepID=A0A1D7X7P1_NEOTH|nr:2-amino-3,7-dideoxy-D-threo-hept-6-ulosonate synthase [Moorella thermoacetica]AKX93225.1 2-amino-4,5-dihydroxy-6-oxo-7-(phosphonooxy)heptanoate synthase [Moorella thermoacetica]AKX95867.1 2-amino-4,5-dihydroxy-6-oxo-7-(phosphonooxy)heptanoate synthase [Moorella thermoacetica]AOQ22926.1 2-amino-4,5-dihydroxy-6-one-heptanoic acid-7-phosphate synthase [Moorella thermoacetica]APC07567.1 2-amino-4,5-dihydroxy-6-oxo-7-(phosphonooxy)heptanoate synthase [Moorella thermoacetica]OIQ08285.1 2-amino-4,